MKTEWGCQCLDPAWKYDHVQQGVICKKCNKLRCVHQEPYTKIQKVTIVLVVLFAVVLLLMDFFDVRWLP